MTRSALALVLLVALAGCGGHGLARSFEDRAAGLSLRYPSGWKVDTRNPTAITNPAFCVDLAGRGALIRLVEYERPDLTADALAYIRPRPRRFRMAMFRPGDSEWTRAPTLSFRQHGRAFFVAVRAPASQRATAEDVLNSVRIAARGHCHAGAFER